MLRVRTAVPLLALLTLLLLPSFASARSPQLRMLDKINAYRASHGVKAVHLSRSLEKSASRYSRHMMSSGYFGHSSRIHASRKFRTLGEIIEIHRGLKAGVRTAFQAWIHSPPHRSVILMSTFRFAGAGFVSGRFNGHRDTIWTMHFGRH